MADACVLCWACGSDRVQGVAPRPLSFPDICTWRLKAGHLFITSFAGDDQISYLIFYNVVAPRGRGATDRAALASTASTEKPRCAPHAPQMETFARIGMAAGRRAGARPFLTMPGVLRRCARFLLSADGRRRHSMDCCVLPYFLCQAVVRPAGSFPTCGTREYEVLGGGARHLRSCNDDAADRTFVRDRCISS